MMSVQFVSYFYILLNFSRVCRKYW